MIDILTKHVKRARFPRVLLLFITIQTALFVPVIYNLLRTQPYDMHARLNGFSSFTDMDYEFEITPDEVSYNDGRLFMGMPAEIIPQQVREDKDYFEIYNYLALYNGYYARILLPLVLITGAVFFVSQALLYVCAAWIFGQTRMMTEYMTMAERFAACVYASFPGLFPGVLLGFFVPVFHAFIFELVMVYVTYKIMGKY